MKFQTGKTYRHMSTTDIDIYVASALEITEEGTKAHVWYWNRNYNFFQGSPEDVFIKSEDYDKWQEVEVYHKKG